MSTVSDQQKATKELRREGKFRICFFKFSSSFLFATNCCLLVVLSPPRVFAVEAITATDSLNTVTREKERERRNKTESRLPVVLSFF